MHVFRLKQFCTLCIYIYIHITCRARICTVYIPWTMFTGNLTLIMGYEFNSCGILQLKMQGWVGRVTLCIGEFFHAHPLYFVPALICIFHTYLNPWVRIRCERYAGICNPIFRFQMRWNNQWCNAMWKSIYDFIGDHPCPPTRRKQSLPELSIVMLFRLHFSSLLVLFKFEMVYVVLPPCVGCESVCDDVYDYIYVWYARCLHICLYDVYIYIFMWCTVGARSFIKKDIYYILCII